jgi:hypothetical protein
MKIFVVISLFTFTILLLSACDPPKLLVIKANTKNNTSVTVHTNQRIIPFGDKDDESKMIIQVPFNDTAKKTFNYGIGNWPNDAIVELSANIDSIIIINSTGKLTLINKSDIQRYLKKHRSGYAGSVLIIEAK